MNPALALEIQTERETRKTDKVWSGELKAESACFRRFDGSAGFQAWSLQHLAQALPVVGSDPHQVSRDDDGKDELSLEDVGHDITEEEVGKV